MTIWQTKIISVRFLALFFFSRLSLKMTKFSLVVCKIIVAIFLKTFVVGFLEK